jgi:hypothetical protein
MPNILSLIIILLLIIAGSYILLLSIFGARLIMPGIRDKFEQFRTKNNTVFLTLGVILILGAFSLIIYPQHPRENGWTSVQKEEMIKKIMESSIFVHGIGNDTARLISECFIDKYTRTYSPVEMKEQNKMSNEDIARLTSVIMIECLKKYGLPLIDTSALK